MTLRFHSWLYCADTTPQLTPPETVSDEPLLALVVPVLLSERTIDAGPGFHSLKIDVPIQMREPPSSTL